MDDCPGFEVRDCLLDHPANLINLGVLFLLPVEDPAARRLLEGRDHSVAGIALVADPVLRVHCQQHAGFT